MSKNEATKEQMATFMSDLVSEIIKSVESGEPLPWQSPFFIGYMKGLVNPTRTTDPRTGKPCPEGYPYGGMMNPFLLYFGAKAAQKRHGGTVIDHRFVPKSQIFCKPQYKVTERVEVKGFESPSERVPYEEYTARIRKAIDTCGITIFFPLTQTVRNKDFDPSQPEGPGNRKTFSIPTGKFGTGCVINVKDTNLVEIGFYKPIDETTEKENPPISEIQTVLDKVPHVLKHAECVPHYSLSTREISMPELKHAKSPLAYYTTLIHEITHMLQDMCGEISSRGDMQGYSFNELVADMASVYVAASLGFVNIESDETKNTVAYTNHWLGVMKADPMILFEAATKASKYGDMILNGRLPRDIKNRERFTFLPKDTTGIEEEESATGTEG